MPEHVHHILSSNSPGVPPVLGHVHVTSLLARQGVFAATGRAEWFWPLDITVCTDYPISFKALQTIFEGRCYKDWQALPRNASASSGHGMRLQCHDDLLIDCWCSVVAIAHLHI